MPLIHFLFHFFTARLCMSMGDLTATDQLYICALQNYPSIISTPCDYKAHSWSEKTLKHAISSTFGCLTLPLADATVRVTSC